MPRYLVPTLFPVNSCVQYNNRYLIDPSVHPDQSEPTVLHWSEFIIVQNQPVVIQLVLINRSLMIEFNWILRPKFMNRDYVLFGPLDFSLSSNVAFKRSDKKTVWTFFYFANFDVFGAGQIFPLFSVFYVHSLRNVGDWVSASFLSRSTII